MSMLVRLVLVRPSTSL